jgi:hypothetical protein
MFYIITHSPTPCHYFQTSSSSTASSPSVRFNRPQLQILPDYPPPRTTAAAAIMLVLGTVLALYVVYAVIRLN